MRKNIQAPKCMLCQNFLCKSAIFTTFRATALNLAIVPLVLQYGIIMLYACTDGL